MKRLVIFCDGTWNRADQQSNGRPTPTNVVKAAYRTAKRDGRIVQVIYYDQGVGTGNLLDRITGGAFGKGLEDNVHDAYRFLVANYEAGDQIFLFGFSRGAYTVRSIAGMIRKCGILRRDSVINFKDAVTLYRAKERPDDPGPREFRRRHSVSGTRTIKIRFIGVWDTVGALGVPLSGLRWLTRHKYQFHDTELSGSVENAFHALAVDERRGAFAPALWEYKPKAGQVVEQTWFCGAHSDVGGGYETSSLSDISLLWMLERARRCGLGLDRGSDKAFPPRPDPLGKIHNSRKGIYRLLPGRNRVIGLAKDPRNPKAYLDDFDPHQEVHESVVQRWKCGPGYRPPQLKKYLEKKGMI